MTGTRRKHTVRNLWGRRSSLMSCRGTGSSSGGRRAHAHQHHPPEHGGDLDPRHPSWTCPSSSALTSVRDGLTLLHEIRIV